MIWGVVILAILLGGPSTLLAAAPLTGEVCGEDLNGDGYFDDEGELSQCIDGVCPHNTSPCTREKICSLGDFPCDTNGNCTEVGICSSSQYAYDRYYCSITGREYDTANECTINCTTTSSGTCQALSNNNRIFWVAMGVTSYTYGKYYDVYPSRELCQMWFPVSAGNAVCVQKTGTSGFKRVSSYLVLNGSVFSNPAGYTITILPSSYQELGWATLHPYSGQTLYVRNTWPYNLNTIGDGVVLSPYYQCSLNGTTFQDVFNCITNCSSTTSVACETRSYTGTNWDCSLTGIAYAAEADCISACSNTQQCIEGPYTCPSGGYACSDVIGTGDPVCSANVCVDLGTSPPQVTPTDTSTYQNDGTVDPDTGECSGVFKIFNGKGKECLQNGWDTMFFNCCNDSADSFLIFNEFCPEESVVTVQAKQAGRAHFIGTYCKKDIKFIGCIQRADRYCLFNSKMARIVHEQGRAQLQKFAPDGKWGSPEDPNCEGFTPEEFQMLDFSQIDLSELFGDIIPVPTTEVQTDVQDAINRFQENLQ